MTHFGRVLSRELVEPFLDALYPPRCRLCGCAAEDDLACDDHRLPDAPLGPRCDRCAGALPPALPDGTRCAACRRQRPGFRRVVALGDYQAGELREWVLALKHGGRRDLAHPLGVRLARRWLDSAPSVPAELIAARAVLVPVPLHPWRALERGYDQARALALALARSTGVPIRAVLKRSRATAPQGTPGAVSRAANVRGAFRVRRPRRARQLLEGRDAWIVDDVLTSGATASECARTLRAFGARTVSVLVVARAGERP